MFVGMISSIVTGDPNPSSMLVSLGLGVPALLIIILSSVTTNVMNLYSSAISFVNVFPKIEPWKIIVGGGVAITGVAVIPKPDRPLHPVPHDRPARSSVPADRHPARRLLPAQKAAGRRGTAAGGQRLLQLLV